MDYLLNSRYLKTTLIGLSLTLFACSDSSTLAIPQGTNVTGQFYPADKLKFLYDESFENDAKKRVVEQQIFDEIFALIQESERFLLLDMFLFNDFSGELESTGRPLSKQLTDLLVVHRQRYPECEIIFITDPVNTVYGGLTSSYLKQLNEAGVEVVITDLNQLRDSNPMWSKLGRVLLPLAETLDWIEVANPFDKGSVPLSSYVRLLNFKANHRKLVIGAGTAGMSAIVSSANPHDGSSAHSNVGVRFSGAAVMELLKSEQAVLEFSGGPDIKYQPLINFSSTESNGKIRILTEQAIKLAALEVMAQTEPGDRIDMAMFYLSERQIIAALKDAKRRGVNIRLLLDPNKDAFGRIKNGIPNRAVAHELKKEGIDIRWCNTLGEQCHSKMLAVKFQDQSVRVILGSANFTRRNLNNFNLETNVEIKANSNHPEMKILFNNFSRQWHPQPNQKASLAYAAYEDDGFFKYWQYRFMEASGMSTF